MSIETHLDALNDLVLDYTKRQTKASRLAVEAYCEQNDLDPEGFSLTWVDEAWVVTIAEDTHDESEAEGQEYSSKMAKALAKARPHYTKAVASSGKKSLHNGDELATKLQGCEPEEVCLLADLVCEEAIGTHYAKYAHLNQGQQRMNAGNKIRGRIKRGEILLQTVIELADANLATLQVVADSE